MPNHEHLIVLVRKIMNAEGTEEELDDMLTEVQTGAAICRGQ